MSDIPRYDTTSPILASFAQERMWFLEKLDPENSVYNLLHIFIIKGPLDVGLLRRSLGEVVRRQGVLRTTLYFTCDRLYQRVIPPAAIDLPLVDLSVHGGRAEEEARCLAIAEVKRPFDLEKEPAIRALLFKISPEEHTMALITHHVAFDGWSVSIMVSELSAIYASIRNGRPLPREPAVRYVDYALWQRKRYERGDFEAQLGYWQDKLKGELPLLELPTDRPRPAVQSFGGAVYVKELPAFLTESLKAIARGEKATLFMALLSAYAAFLYRYTGQEDIIMGCPIAGRNYRELEGTIGLFTNTLPMRARISGDMTFRELLRSVRKTAFEAYENQDLSFEKLVESLSVPRQPSTTPIFQTLFQLRNLPATSVSCDGIEWIRYDIHYTTAKFDLTLEITETPSGLYCRFEYPTALFDRATIERMAGHWENILMGIVSEPDLPISKLPLLSTKEFRRAIVDWNDTKTDYPSMSVHRIFEERAAESPGSVAVTHNGKGMAYGELNALANRLARYIQGLGIGSGTPIALSMDRSIDTVVCELAILKAGCSYVPIDPAYPPERVRFMLEDVNSGAILVKQNTNIKGVCRVIAIDDAYDGAAQQDGDNLPDGVGPEATAYIMYTSGSTGLPKGVRVSHRGIVRLVINTNLVDIGPGDVVAFTQNPTFDVSTLDVWGALLNGSKLAIVDKETLLSPARFAALVEEEGITTLTLITQLFNIFSLNIPGAFRHVRDVIFVGEAADPPSVGRVLACGPPERLVNGYGPTENTTLSTYYVVGDVPGDNVPIGKPISNSTAYVLDAWLQPVPVGVTGEIYVGGDGVARGYHGRPDLTSAVFIPDPFTGNGAMLYRTGDLGCYLPDGNIKFLGRRDRQLKIRGFRVEPDEVKAVLETHPLVASALVVAKDYNDDRRLVAYLMAKEPVEPGPLCSYLLARLPEYMVPAVFMVIDAFPLMPNGKIDHRALPEPAHGCAPRVTGPADEVEQALAGIWEDILGFNGIGAEDDFFELGGHSLAAVRLVARIEEKFKVKLPLNTVFLMPTLRGMARAIRERWP